MRGHNDTKPTTSRGSLAITLTVPLLGLVFALGGCTVGPNFATPQASASKTMERDRGPASRDSDGR